MALAFSAVVTRFVHLEEVMPEVLGVLLGYNQAGPSGYLLRAIVNAKTRADLMEQLLQRAPNNAKLGTGYDEILVEFRALSKLRNDWVHGSWQTHETGDCYMSLKEPNGHTHAGARLVDPADLEAVAERITQLWSRVHITTMVTFGRRTRREGHSGPSFEP